MPSTPKHVFLYEAFNWSPPAFVHVGLLQNEEKKKLSKRDGDVDVDVYRKKGYLPEALNNFVALLGWSHTRKNDTMTMQDLIDEVTFYLIIVTLKSFVEKLIFCEVYGFPSDGRQYHSNFPQTRFPSESASPYCSQPQFSPKDQQSNRN